MCCDFLGASSQLAAVFSLWELRINSYNPFSNFINTFGAFLSRFSLGYYGNVLSEEANLLSDDHIEQVMLKLQDCRKEIIKNHHLCREKYLFFSVPIDEGISFFRILSALIYVFRVADNSKLSKLLYNENDRLGLSNVIKSQVLILF